VHLNFFQKVPRREYRFEFTEASVCFNFFEQRIKVLGKGQSESFQLENFERNDLFLAQTEDFFQRAEKYTLDESLQNIRDAARIVELCDPNG
jgi:hypothetical protein